MEFCGDCRFEYFKTVRGDRNHRNFFKVIEIVKSLMFDFSAEDACELFD